jgi:hypothetical protein
MSIELQTSRGLMVEYPTITYRQIDYWVREGYLAHTPVVGQAMRGSGSTRVFAGDELTHARTVCALVVQGMQPSVASDVARQLLTRDTARLGEFALTRIKE